MTTYYVKDGRRYRAISQYDDGVMRALPAGCHLVCVDPGVTSTVYSVNPAHAPVMAALRLNREACIQAMRKASEIMPVTRPNTPIEMAAWRAYVNVLKHEDAALRLSVPSAMDVLAALETALLAHVKAG